MLKVDEKKSENLIEKSCIDFYRTGCLFDIFLTMRSQPNKMEELGAHWSFICHHCRRHFPYHHLQKPPQVAFSCSFGGEIHLAQDTICFNPDRTRYKNAC